MAYTLVAPVGEDLENLYVGIREFPIRKVVLLTPEEKRAMAEESRRDLERLRIPVEIVYIRGNLFEEIFRAIGEIRREVGEEGLLVNVATGDKISGCAALSAAFVNGLKAFGVVKGDPMLLPVLKFSYYRLISDKKMRILKVLQERGPSTLEEVISAVGMSPSLVSYHVHGSQKSEGLLKLGLVRFSEEGGKKRVGLTTLGVLLVRGYVD
jgi:DNA-binding transcriptional ArsR family regulator